MHWVLYHGLTQHTYIYIYSVSSNYTFEAIRMAAAILHRSDMQQLLGVAGRTCRRFRNSKVSISKPKPPSTMSSTRSAYLAASIMPCKSCSQAVGLSLVSIMLSACNSKRHAEVDGHVRRMERDVTLLNADLQHLLGC